MTTGDLLITLLLAPCTLLAALLNVAWFRRAFTLGLLGLAGWAVAALAAALGVAWFEVYKARLRRARL